MFNQHGINIDIDEIETGRARSPAPQDVNYGTSLRVTTHLHEYILGELSKYDVASSKVQ